MSPLEIIDVIQGALGNSRSSPSKPNPDRVWRGDTCQAATVLLPFLLMVEQLKSKIEDFTKVGYLPLLGFPCAETMMVLSAWAKAAIHLVTSPYRSLAELHKSPTHMEGALLLSWANSLGMMVRAPIRATVVTDAAIRGEPHRHGYAVCQSTPIIPCLSDNVTHIRNSWTMRSLATVSRVMSEYGGNLFKNLGSKLQENRTDGAIELSVIICPAADSTFDTWLRVRFVREEADTTKPE